MNTTNSVSLPEMAQHVAEHLSNMSGTGVWTVQPLPADDWRSQHLIALVDLAGIRIWLSDAGNKNRLFIEGDWPHDECGRVYPCRESERTSSISVGRDRSPASIAREINRRFLPDYLPTIHKALADRAKDASVQRSREELATELAGILGTQSHAETCFSSPAGSWGVTGEVGYDNVHLQVDVPAHVARDVLRLLQRAEQE